MPASTATARFLCRLDIPAFDNVREFGSDCLIARERDSLDVDGRVGFPLATPAGRR